MPKVLIDGIEYVPKAEVPPLTDERLHSALKKLTSIQYFNQARKNRAVAWDALNALAPDLAKLAADDPQAAYARVHGVED